MLKWKRVKFSFINVQLVRQCLFARVIKIDADARSGITEDMCLEYSVYENGKMDADFNRDIWKMSCHAGLRVFTNIMFS